MWWRKRLNHLLFEFRTSETIGHAFVSLDAIDIEEDFQRRAVVMRSPPKFLERAYVSALRVAMEEIQRGRQVNDETGRSRGWKLFLSIPRMLFHGAPRGGLIPKNRLRERFAQFADGRWIILILASWEVCTAASLLKSSKIANNPTRLSVRAERARVLASLVGELFAARQALEGAALAPGDEVTLAALRDRQRRPRERREPILHEISEYLPEHQFALDGD